MQKISAMLLLLGAFAVAAPSSAQEQPKKAASSSEYTPEQVEQIKKLEATYKNVVYHLDVVEMTDEAAARYAGKVRLPKGFQPGSGEKVIAETDLLTQTDKEALVHVGHKNPIVYYDPRASQFQVQYVDVGLKLDIKASDMGDGDFFLDLRPELSVLQKTREASSPIAAIPAAYPQTQVFTVQAVQTHVHYDEAVLLSRLQGPSAQIFLESIYGSTAVPRAGGHNLFYFVTVKRP